MSSANIKVGSLWKPIQKISVKVSSSWQAIKSGWVKTSTGWKQFFSSIPTPSIESQVLITKTLQTDYTYTLSGTNYHWIDYNTLTYYFEYSTDQVSWSTLSTSTPTNPVSGSSNTQGPISVDSLYINAGANYFRYRVYAVNSTYSTSANSTSSSTIIYGPAKPTISSVSISGSGGTYSGTVSWGSATNASSYRVYFPDGSTVDTSSTSATKSFTGSPSTSYNFYVRAFSGSIISSSVSGYYGPLSDAYSASTPANPQLSDPTGIMVWVYDPNFQYLTINWNSVTNATSYYWKVESTDSTYLDTGYVSTNSFSIFNVPNSKTIKVYVQAQASGYTSSNLIQMSPNYTTPEFPSPPSSASVSVTSNSITISSFVGGSTYKATRLYKYNSIFSDSSLYTDTEYGITTSKTFSSLSSGTVWDIKVYGASLGTASGIATWYRGLNYLLLDSFYTYATIAPTSVTTTFNLTYQNINSFLARLYWVGVPSSLPPQVTYFQIDYYAWKTGDTPSYKGSEGYRVDGSSWLNDTLHTTGRGSLTSISGNTLADRGENWGAYLYALNYTGSAWQNVPIAGTFIYIP